MTNRTELQALLISNIVSTLSAADLAEIVTNNLEMAYAEYSGEQLIAEIKELYPQLLPDEPEKE